MNLIGYESQQIVFYADGEPGEKGRDLKKRVLPEIRDKAENWAKDHDRELHSDCFSPLNGSFVRKSAKGVTPVTYRLCFRVWTKAEVFHCD